MKKTLLLLTAAVVSLTACGTDSRREITRFDTETQCSAQFTGKKDRRRERGSCTTWATKSDGTKGNCIAYNYNYYTYLERQVNCSKKEWIR